MLRVAVIGYDRRLTREATRKLAESDCDESIDKIEANGNIRMSGGTLYIPVYDFTGTRGNIYDQLIIVDDYRWMIFEKQRDTISNVTSMFIMSEYIFDTEVEIQKYEW